jgi:biopolymer transport protein ExbB
MNLTERLLAFTLLGAEWVLWLLVALSVVSVAVMVERTFALRGRISDLEGLARKLPRLLVAGDVEGARLVLGDPRSPEARVALEGLAELDRGRTAVADAMASAKSRERLSMEKNLGVLGTLGNNAPFIGLFGTVLGIIKAFSDLSKNRGGGAEVVMAGISEALVATAVGLLVAIPAVVAFNVFQARVRRAMGRIDAMAHLVLSAKADTGDNGIAPGVAAPVSSRDGKTAAAAP